MLAFNHFGVEEPTPISKGYDLMKPINQLVVQTLRTRAVSEGFIATYLQEVPDTTADFDTVATWWGNYLQNQPHMASIAFYLRNTRTVASWLHEFEKSVLPIILKAH